MPKNWRIRYKLLLGVTMLFCILGILSFSGFQGSYAYRRLAKSISHRVTEIPLANDLAQSIALLRSRLHGYVVDVPHGLEPPTDIHVRREQFRNDLLAVKVALQRYNEKLNHSIEIDPHIGDTGLERSTVEKIERSLKKIEQMDRDQDWNLDVVKTVALGEELDELHRNCNALPSHLHERMHGFADEVRSQYRTWILLSWVTTAAAVVMLLLLVYYFCRLIAFPLRILFLGSRKVAAGDFSHRIHLNSSDEMGELAGAMNNMTEEFQRIYEHLDEQVKQRTREVIRNEQLASVGFLAAGVAHEINNPLASIAWAAESLESRVLEILESHRQEAGARGQESQDPDSLDEAAILHKYLKNIQDEAFRCKGITEKLLDFSRLGEPRRQDANLSEIVKDVIDVVQHVGAYKEKSITCQLDEPVIAHVNPQEIKQVALNLVTNALDSLDPGGAVDVRVRQCGKQAEILVQDDGCGMSEEVMQHLFEPFFTRRRSGQGTGLGLSITYRIVADHGGTITAASEGPGAGSQFHVTFPLVQNEKEEQVSRKAA